MKITKSLTALFRSWHRVIISLGLLPGLVYLPTWIFWIVTKTIRGSSSPFLNICFIALGCYLIFSEKDNIRKFRADSEDRFVGYALIAGSVTMFWFFLQNPYLQAVTWAISLCGISLSIFGSRFVRTYWLAMSVIAIGLLHRYDDIGYAVGRLILPNYLLPKFMALVSSYILQWLGQPAIVNGKIIELGSGGVDIADGCSGYSMAAILAGVGFVMGVFYRLRPIKISLIMLSGVIIALTLNVPRIVLLTYSAVYWGDDAFKFWHFGWGSQILAGTMFTVFYYVSMAICKKKEMKHPSP